MLELFTENGLSLAVGVGATRVPVTFQSSNDPPYFISRSSDNVCASATRDFYYSEELTEYLEQNCIPFDVARNALAEFAETGCRPTTLQWELL
jgi:hypothetical protein